MDWLNDSRGSQENNDSDSLSTSNLDPYTIIPLAILLSLLSLVTFIGNVMVLHAIRTEKKLQTVSNIFIMSLAIADCSVGLFVMPISAIYGLLGFWPFGLTVCNIWLSMDYVASTASIFNLFALSLDRFWSIISPLKYLKKRTRTRAFIMCSSVWLASFLWIIPVVAWHHIHKDSVRQVPPGICDTEFSNEQIFKVLTAIFNFYAPMAAMIALYSRIFHEIKVRAKAFASADMVISQPSVRVKKVPVTVEPEPLPPPPSAFPSPASEMPNGELPSLVDMEVPHIIVETPEEGTPRTRKRKVLNYNGITLIRFVHEENISKEEYEQVDVDVEVEFDSDELLTTLQLPGRKIEDDCISLSDYGENDEETDEEKPKKIKTSFRKKTKTKLQGLSPRRFSRKLSRVPDSIEVTPRNSDPSIQTPSFRQRLLSNINFTKNKSQPPDSQPASSKPQKPDQPANKFNREKKAAFQLGVILGAFCLCFMPYFVSFIILAFCPTCISPHVHLIFTWLGYLNSTVNPFLYPWTNANFRSSFRKMFCFKEPKISLHNYLNYKMPVQVHRRQIVEERKNGLATQKDNSEQQGRL